MEVSFSFLFHECKSWCLSWLWHCCLCSPWQRRWDCASWLKGLWQTCCLVSFPVCRITSSIFRWAKRLLSALFFCKGHVWYRARWHNQDLLSVVFDWDLGKITGLLSPTYPKHACLLLQFLLLSIVARMDLCWAISHSSCVITIIVMKTQKQRLNALCLLKNIFIPLHCCDFWGDMCWWLLKQRLPDAWLPGILKSQNDSLLSQIAWLEYVKWSCQVKNNS